MRIWEFTNYRDYLGTKLDAEGARSGLRKKLAAAIPAHTSFISQVINGNADFSLEQAESTNDFFAHNETEGEYFILLVLKDRAGNEKLKKRFAQKITDMQEQNLNIKNRLAKSDEISAKDKEKFYSNSIYGAIHVLAAIEQYQSIEAMAAVTRLSRNRIRDIADFLIRIGILVEDGGKIKSGSSHVHLGNDSELILKHHINWRQHTIANLQFLDKDDLHYSGCMSLSAADTYRIKESMLDNLKKNIEIVSHSKEEVAYTMCLDFFKVYS